MSNGTSTAARPFIVGMGGTTRPNSTSAAALRAAMESAASAGAETRVFGPDDLDFPMFRPDSPRNATAKVVEFVSAMRGCDGLVIATPAYHGGVSGMIKNALDHMELLQDTGYLDGRAVGCITCGYGDQAPVQALNSLRTYIHHLRGWPTPLGVTIAAYPSAADTDGRLIDDRLVGRIEKVVDGVLEFASLRTAHSRTDLRASLP